MTLPVSRPQKVLVLTMLLIVAIGLLCLYSSCHQKGLFVKKDIFVKQLWWAGAGFVLMFFVSRFDYRQLSLFVIPVYLAAFLTLLFVLVAGRAIMGAQRWLTFGEISFQPSELGKFALILALSHYYSRWSAKEMRLQETAVTVISSLLLPLSMTVLLAGPVLAQPDLGTALVYFFIFFSIASLTCLPLRYLIAALAVAVACLPVFWHFLRDYQKSRLLVFLNPNIDPLGAGYTVIQSRIAVGSGQLFGRGWMSGTQSQLNFLAERHTDFIFSVIGEELGFFGSVILLALYAALLCAILRIAETARDTFGRLFCMGAASVLFFHVAVNIAMNSGFCPVVGLPLPFVSYGGSSLVINLIVLGIVLNIAKQK